MIHGLSQEFRHKVALESSKVAQCNDQHREIVSFSIVVRPNCINRIIRFRYLDWQLKKATILSIKILEIFLICIFKFIFPVLNFPFILKIHNVCFEFMSLFYYLLLFETFCYSVLLTIQFFRRIMTDGCPQNGRQSFPYAFVLR